MPESPRPQARRILAVGAGLEPAMNCLTASRLTAWLPHKNWSGTSDSNRDSLGPRPSGLNRFPSPRIFEHWCGRLSHSTSATPKSWGDRRESNPRGQIHSLPPKPLGHGHTCEGWLRAGELNATRVAYEASMTPVHLPALKLVGAPRQTRTGFSGLQIRCVAIYAYRARGSCCQWSGCGESNSVDRLATRCPANRPHPRIQLSKTRN